MPPIIPIRPAYSRCSCVWPEESSRLKKRMEEEENIENKMDALTSPIATAVSMASKIPSPGAFGNSSGNEESGMEDRHSSSEDTMKTNLSPQIRPLNYQERIRMQKENLDRDTAARMELKRSAANGKGLAMTYKRDTIIRTLKKQASRSSENKTRALFSYKQDLVIILNSLIPTHTTTLESHLCPSCMTSLTFDLSRSPARLEPYIQENSTRGFLSLVDDAVASLEAGVEMEVISHRVLEKILRAELAVVEWRSAQKLARYHKKTDFLNLFPTGVGEFAEIRIAKSPTSRPEGILRRAGKSILKGVGLGSSSAAPEQSEVLATAQEAE